MTFWTTRDRLVGSASALVAIVGAVMLVIGLSTPTSFGWFAYSALSENVLTSSGVYVLTPSTVIGAALVAIGTAGVAFVLGTAHGAKRHDRRDGPTA